MEPEPYVWAIYVSSFAAVGRNKGYNQLYLIQLGEARKLGNRNERRRAGKRWATLPPTVSDTVGFGYLSNVFFLWYPPLFVLGGFRRQKLSKKHVFLEKTLRRNAVNSSVFAVCGLLPWKM